MDEAVYSFVAGFSQRSIAFDRALLDLSQTPFSKSFPPVLLFWVLWFWPGGDRRIARAKLITTLFIAAFAMMCGRLAALLLPHAPRPMYTSFFEGGLLDPERMRMSEWSAFPSDHAVLFFALATCFLMVNRTAGIFALLHAAIIICIPRIFFGLHWPSDIIGGAGIGVAIAVTLMGPLNRKLEQLGLIDGVLQRPLLLYPVLVIATFQIATMFESIRRVLGAWF